MRSWFILMLIGPALCGAAEQIRVTVQEIEVPQPVLTGWLAESGVGGAELHRRAVELSIAGKAEITDTTVLTVRSGHRADLVSGAEIISPGKLEPQRVAIPQGLAELARDWKPYARSTDGFFAAFETRNTGVDLRIEPTSEAGLVELLIDHEFVERSGLTTQTEFRDRWGDASYRTPVFDTKRLKERTTLAHGKFELLAVVNATPDGPVAAPRSLMTFVRAEILITK